MEWGAQKRKFCRLSEAATSEENIRKKTWIFVDNVRPK
jgi:hypothetical protein